MPTAREGGSQAGNGFRLRDLLATWWQHRAAKYTAPDPRIVVVSIDQRSQEVLGKWPFSRKHFGEMLDQLRKDGARVVSFDVTFDKPDQTVAPIRALWGQIESDKKEGKPPDPRMEAHVAELAKNYDSDAIFGAALRRFGPVVLGNFYLQS